MSIKMERVMTDQLRPGSKSARSFMEKSAFMRALLRIVGVMGVSLIMSGMLIGPLLVGRG